MKIIFFGSSKFVIPIIEKIRQNFDLVLVVTTEHEATDAVPNYCKKNNIQYLSLKQCNNETIEQLKITQVPVAVLAYFGLILPQEVLDIFPKGIINVHPSLLPQYRGPTPGQTALLNGDKETGISIIKLDEEVDHGPILVQKIEPIHPDDTAETLYERLFTKGAEMLVSSLHGYLNGELELKEQDHSKATFTDHLTRNSGYFDITNPPSQKQLDCMIRAYYPWPGVWTKVDLGSDPREGRTLQQKIIKFLPEKKLQVEGKKPMSYKDFINGYPDAKSAILPLLQMSNTTNQ